MSRARTRWPSVVAALLVAAASVGASPARVQGAAPDPIPYSGGPVVVNPHVFIDYWGPEWSSFTDSNGYTQAQVKKYIETFFQNVGGSYWLGTLTEYFQYPLYGTKTYINNPTGQFDPNNDVWNDTQPVPSPLYKSNILTEAGGFAGSHFYPPGDFDRVYFIFTGPNKAPVDLDSDKPNTCAYHDWTQVSGHKIAYAYVPYQSTISACSSSGINSGIRDSFGHGPLDRFSIAAAHEYAEAITDPDLSAGWREELGDEIGDRCESNPDNAWLGTQYFAVQGVWDNRLATCTLAPGLTPSPYPTCTAPTLTAAPAGSTGTGMAVNLTALASGCPSPTYRFSVLPPGGSWTLLRDYSQAWTYPWSGGGKRGTYQFKVEARDKKSTATYESTLGINYQLVGCSSASISTSGSPVVTISASATCPGTKTYRFWIKTPSGVWTIVRDYSTTSTYAWNTTGLAAGAYVLDVHVRDQGSTEDYEAFSAITYNVAPVPGGPDFVGNISGDFNGDGYSDLAVLYNYGGTTSGIWVWLGRSDGTFAAPARWWYGTSFDASKSKIVAGNFNGDSYRDLAVLYNYGTNITGVWVWSGNGTAFAPPVREWYATTFDWSHSKLTAGDYNGDGYWDLGVMYDYGGSTSGFFWWPGSSTGLHNASQAWKYTTFSYSASKVTSGDYNGDGYDDLGVLYNYGSSTVGIWVWKGSSTGLTATTRWFYGSGYDWNNAKVITADFNGAYTLHSLFPINDFGVVYNNGSSTAIWLWQGQTNSTFKPQTLWWQSAAYDWYAMKVTAGDFNGDTYDDLAIYYDYGGTTSGILIFRGTTNSFADPILRWQNSTFAWTMSQVA